MPDVSAPPKTCFDCNFWKQIRSAGPADRGKCTNEKTLEKCGAGFTPDEDYSCENWEIDERYKTASSSAG